MCKMPCFRERLNQLLTDSGKTIVAFAEFLGTSRQSLGYYLNGERVPDALMVKQICERCNVSADWLLGLSDVQKCDTDLQAVCEYTGLSENAINNILYAKNDEHQSTIKTLDALLSNDAACWNFYASLTFMLLAYDSWVELAKKGELLNRDRAIDADSWNEDLAFFKIYKHMEEATKNLIVTDALKGIYQGEE